ncbi:amidohydrolase [Lamprobacter modestohalophilus]|uniref:Amidohydrolase n=1 Tax=Lamprobacter modestohalophilus TaxID=1064514 RepID=A0A9X1B727_9GAMM|nr:amidohydrolase [Lamprobacter modestohalophilus]MBK1621362.1 amidohydrolase [Lamprobacter modestohalophilus]
MIRFTTAAVLLLASACAVAQTADRIWSGGPILTMNDAAMRAEAIAEQDGRIIAVGSRDEVMQLRGSDTQLIDLDGRALLPGFVDAHGHVMMGGLQALSANLLAPPDGEVTDIASLQQVLRDWVAANQAAVDSAKLIIGFGYDNAQLKELRHPTRDDLDAVSSDYPILIIHQSGHLAALNSKALEIAGISAASKDPEGGVIRRRAGSGEPNGVLEELAMFSALFKILPAIGADGFKAFARAGSELWARFGYTTAQEGRSSPDTVRIMREVADEGGFAIDVVTYPDVLIDRDFIKAGVSPRYDQRLRIGGAKLTIDGSPQGFTAWRDQPYYKVVGDYPPGYSGYAAATAEQVFDAALWAAENEIQLITHANGERAMDLLIAAQRAAAARHPEAGALRPALIHGQFVRADQLDDFKALGVIPSLFPMHTFYWGDWHLEHTVGPEKGQNISPTGWVLERDMIFTSHHDAPVAFPDSMRVLDATVTRRARGSGVVVGPQHRVDVITALKAMTIWPAYQHFEEATKGSLEPGKLADFVILSADPTAVDPETLDTLDTLDVTETIKEGLTVFRLDARTARAAENPGFTRAMAALAGASHAPRMIQPSAWSRVLAGQKSVVTTACLSDLFLALSDGMASAPGR